MNRLRTLITLCIALATAGQNAFAEMPLAGYSPCLSPETQNLRQELSGLMQRYARYEQFCGAILIARNGEILYKGAFGKANRELGTPNALSTRFAIASITKTFTAILALRLVDQGRLSLDGHIRDYLPEYPSPTGNEITLRQLLTHTSGLQGDIGDFPTTGSDFPDRVTKINGDFYTLDEIIPMIAARSLLSLPGKEYHYSSDGYAVLGAIIAKVCGKGYETVLADEIFKPLGMTETDYAPQTTVIPQRASGYRQTFDGYENARPIGISPAGGITSTVGDLFKLDRALDGNGLLSERSKTLVWKPSPYITAYGYKVRPDPTAPRNGALKVIASGSLPGFNSLYTRTLSDNICVIALVNTRDMTFRLDEITDNALALLRGRTITEPRPSAAQGLARTLKAKGLPTALDAYRGWRNSKSSPYYFSEGEFNSLGYYLLGKRQFAEAIAVFTLNTEAYPTSANAFDSLGEAYLASGDQANALKYYERSLQLDAKNENAANVLQRLREGKP